MTKWEYCVIKGVDYLGIGLTPSYPKLILFSLNGISEVDLSNKSAKTRPAGWEIRTESEYVAHTVAKLGLDGWEMVNAVGAASVQGTGATNLYFRRTVNG